MSVNLENAVNMFKPYGKTPRFGKGGAMTITEKIDGTNGQIQIKDGQVVCIGSRNRDIYPDKDNFGFARWVVDNAEGLVQFLGDGVHYGEWAGPGIQKNPLGLPEKRFFLFNIQRNPLEKFVSMGGLVPDMWPVPLLYYGVDFDVVDEVLQDLVRSGTRVVGGSGAAEGVVVSMFGQKFKKTPKNQPKGVQA